MKTKQEVIQDAYGDAWECLKGHVDDNGFVTALREDPTGDTHPLKHGFPLAEIQMKHFLDSFDWRPNSIRDIERNNGWIRVEDKLPDDQSRVTAFLSDRFKLRSAENLTFYFVDQDLFIYRYSHWKLVEEIKPPVY
ncbi:hypothetical protein [Pedobacter sp.]|uniref:hypothetical protein n=1 Tax=Pedobacter sp. TaxID=1411316 RepID=UPI003C51E8BC